jgi:hypothetical protein
MLRRRFLAHGASLALHLLTALIVVRFAAAAFGHGFRTAEERGPALTFVRAPDAPTSAPDEQPGSSAADTTPDDLRIRVDSDETTVAIPGFTFDFGKVARRATSLFPFLMRPLSIERVTVTPRRARGHTLGNPYAQTPVDLVRPPLALRDAAVQAVLDKSWSRRDRWKAFQSIVPLVNAYNPDEGALPGLLKGYGVQNGLQPYVDNRARDPRLWIQLGLAVDHADFIDFIARYASRHPSTKATTELLFLLDKLTQASLDALVTLLDVNPGTDLQWTWRANRGAFELILAIRQYYSAQLGRRQLTSRDALKKRYDDVRLSILTGILRTTPGGYRADDARFLIGAIYWGQGRAGDAVETWREMHVNPEDFYGAASSEMLEAIAGPNVNVRRINRILDGEHGRWVSLSFDRLRQFGYRFDTF